MTRLLWAGLGWAALALAALGAVLPVLPTTPLVLLAAFAFARGSPRMRRRIEESRWFGPALRDWEATGAIRPRYKVIAVGLMGATFAASLLYGVPLLVLAIQAVAMGGASAYMLTRPSR